MNKSSLVRQVSQEMSPSRRNCMRCGRMDHTWQRGAGYNHGARGNCPGKGDRVEEKSKEEMQNLWTPDE